MLVYELFQKVYYEPKNETEKEIVDFFNSIEISLNSDGSNFYKVILPSFSPCYILDRFINQTFIIRNRFFDKEFALDALIFLTKEFSDPENFKESILHQIAGLELGSEIIFSTETIKDIIDAIVWEEIL